MNILLNEHGRLRSGWRATVFLLAYLFSVALLGAAVHISFLALGSEISSRGTAYLIASSLASLIPAILVAWACGKLLENLPFRAVGAAPTANWLKHLTIGLALGAATFAFAVLIAILAGGLRFEVNSDGWADILRSLGASLAVFAVAAAFEEALFRGYILQTFARSGYAWLAIALTSLFFGAVHLGNPNASAISTLNTVLAGVWFSLAYLRTRDLWFVWGLHLIWNWVQGSIFGIEVSGLTGISASPLLREKDAGPTWLTGETYGIEGGLACTVALAISIVVVRSMPGLRPDEELLAMTSPPRPPES